MPTQKQITYLGCHMEVQRAELPDPENENGVIDGYLLILTDPAELTVHVIPFGENGKQEIMKGLTSGIVIPDGVEAAAMAIPKGKPRKV